MSARRKSHEIPVMQIIEHPSNCIINLTILKIISCLSVI